MATFTSGFTPNTSSSGTDLTITDTAVYGGLLPKTVFTSRSVLITKTDGTNQTISFPYTGTANGTQDVLTIPNFFDKDYYITIAMTWVFTNEGVADTKTTTLSYISHYKALTCFVATADKTDCSDNCDSEQSEVLNRLSNYIDNAILWAKFGNGIKSQKYLDASKDLCSSLNDCNYNS